MTFFEVICSGRPVMLAISEVQRITTVKMARADEHGRATDVIYEVTLVTLKNGDEYRSLELYESVANRLRLMGEVP